MSASYIVEADIPVPSRAARYPFASMKPGQSFAIVEHAEDGTVDAALTADTARKVRNAAYQYSRKANASAEKRTGQKGTLRFSLRKLEDGTFRLWCVEG